MRGGTTSNYSKKISLKNGRMLWLPGCFAIVSLLTNDLQYLAGIVVSKGY